MLERICAACGMSESNALLLDHRRLQPAATGEPLCVGCHFMARLFADTGDDAIALVRAANRLLEATL